MPPHCDTTTIGSQLYQDMHISIVDACHCFGTFMHAAVQFYNCYVTVSAESVGGSTPGARVTWNTTVPPECVTYVTVEFRTSSRGSVIANYTTTNTSQTEIIQTGLQCATYYYIRVVVTGGPGGTLMLSPRKNNIVQVLVGGIQLFACDFNPSKLIVVMPLHRYTSPSWSES